MEMHSKRILVSVFAVAAMALMISSVSACCYCKPGLSPGYWKHNVRVYVEDRGSYSGDYPKMTAELLEEYEAKIQVRHPSFTLEWANDMFQDNANKDMWLTIANWFNHAAGRSSYHD
jgi:hypothetical protein